MYILYVLFMHVDVYQCSVNIKVNWFVNLQLKIVYNMMEHISRRCALFCFHLSHDFPMFRTNNGFVSIHLGI